MKLYVTLNDETCHQGRFFTLREAKKDMRENNAKGYIVKVASNGDWESCKKIKQEGNKKQ
jgi:hypothetical protein